METAAHTTTATTATASAATTVLKGLDHPTVQSLLLEAYSKIGEPDGLYGACTTLSPDETTRVHLYEHEGQWEKSLSERNNIRIQWNVSVADTTGPRKCMSSL